jgi:hypothetical protein
VAIAAARVAGRRQNTAHSTGSSRIHDLLIQAGQSHQGLHPSNVPLKTVVD